MGCERLQRAEGSLKDVFDVVEDGEMGVDGESVSGVVDVEVDLPSNVIPSPSPGRAKDSLVGDLEALWLAPLYARPNTISSSPSS